MKGYSFSELVKLAEAAMPRAGGTFDGAITAPQVNIGNSIRGSKTHSYQAFRNCQNILLIIHIIII
ncbi:hypothetical protein ACR2VO_27965 [Klebsiella pneumoniae]